MKYAIITHHDSGYMPLAEITWHDNKTEYARLHGYAMHAKTENWTSASENGLMTGFEKIYWAKQVLEEHPEYEWIWWTGTDTMITNLGTRIQDRIFNSHHFVISVDVNGLNDDSFLVRNTPEGKGFLTDIIARQEEGLKYWDGEQRIISNLCGFPGTSESGWPYGKDAIQIQNKYKDIVKIMPQRYMNSFNYSLYPQYNPPHDKMDWNGNWALGDWLIHWPAVHLEGRLQLANFYKNYIIK